MATIVATYSPTRTAVTASAQGELAGCIGHTGSGSGGFGGSINLRAPHYNLSSDGLKDLTLEEERLAYLAATEGLTCAAQQRLDSIEIELNRRWALFG